MCNDFNFDRNGPHIFNSQLLRSVIKKEEVLDDNDSPLELSMYINFAMNIRVNSLLKINVCDINWALVFLNMMHTSYFASRRFVVAVNWVKRREGGVNTEITVAKLYNNSLTRDGTNTAVGTIDMDDSSFNHVTEPASNPDQEFGICRQKHHCHCCRCCA